MRRLSCTRPNPSTSGWILIGLPYGEHAFDRNQRAAHQLWGDFNSWLEIQQRIAQLFESVEPHVRAFAAIAVFVGNEVEFLPGRKFAQRVAHTALGHHDELLRL